MPRSLSPPSLDAIRAAQVRTADCAVRTPLVRFNVEKPVPADIWLKLENLQPVGSFKLRGAGNAMRLAGPDALERGVWTASAGNMGRAVAWYARQLGVHCTVVVPDDAPAAKVDAIVRLGARIVPLPFARYQEIQRERDYPGADGLLIHPFADQAVMAGNGTIGLEILEDAPDVAAVLVPYGGGGLSCGIAAALHASGSPARVFGCEVASGAPLAASLAAGRPVETDYAPSFVTGIGAPFVFPEMWALASELLAGALVASLSDVAQAIRLLALGNHVVAEGAAAVPVAAALAGQAGRGRIVCVVSGGNIGSAELVTILQGGIPGPGAG